MDVWVTEGQGFGTYYVVWVEGQVYERLQLLNGPRLTWSQQSDMAILYRDALQEKEDVLQSNSSKAL